MSDKIKIEELINESKLSAAQLALVRQMQTDGRTFYKDVRYGWFYWRVGHGNINTATANALIKMGVVICENGEYMLSDRISHFLPSQLRA